MCVCVSVWKTGGQYRDVSTLKVGGQHFTSIRQRSVRSGGTEQNLCQPPPQPPYIYYMACTHNTDSRPRWQGPESPFLQNILETLSRMEETSSGRQSGTPPQDVKQ